MLDNLEETVLLFRIEERMDKFVHDLFYGDETTTRTLIQGSSKDLKNIFISFCQSSCPNNSRTIS
ncbi:hypothetical protein LEP1GSC079_0117 [Leptospira interrogans str. FPW1039]|uniref:Uncharacterized protein n=4 Tax=Leptospira TaxID=171 RepID=M6ZVC5_LEPIR|nr:hypothetical protein LEP1GSC131_0172 [Leptospira kirschneri str. 200802841]EMF44288.1 hypothetical protein LEP1GSC067_1168 [Leptospira interrogans serovar Lora str. TE 1992]EMJ34404.1 hypothetical protein LEP1GSC079_0117 [Leptospira interrogans str. FPW1039]EMO78615.1 hypothetical protein LEP1GSC126_4403 [Leptospira kirschneri str. 200801774]EMP05740.1 hypothetical protein LEP1GSC124_5404 [Leptospira interrogans serovar Pyrogenes str. 200701872]